MNASEFAFPSLCNHSPILSFWSHCFLSPTIFIPTPSALLPLHLTFCHPYSLFSIPTPNSQNPSFPFFVPFGSFYSNPHSVLFTLLLVFFVPSNHSKAICATLLLPFVTLNPSLPPLSLRFILLGLHIVWFCCPCHCCLLSLSPPLSSIANPPSNNLNVHPHWRISQGQVIR